MKKAKKMKMETNIFSENIHNTLEVDEKKAIDVARKILDFYLKQPDIFNSSCLKGWDFNCISFDILYCDNEKSHQVNIEYRQKDYPADIITFAIFADSEEKFVFDGEINLGEIIISLDKIKEKEGEKATINEELCSRLTAHCSRFNNELYFLISHGIMHLLGFDHQTEEDYNFIIKAQTDALEKVRGEQ